MLRGLYRGLGVSVLGAAPATCLYLTSYESAKRKLEATRGLRDHTALLYLSAGMFAEAISCVFWVPIDVIKERMQVQGAVQPIATGASASSRVYYRNTWHAAETILSTEGVRGFYKGYGATLLSFGPFSALYFLFYERSKAFVQRRSHYADISTQNALVCAAVAGATASFLTSPLDMVKLRLQVQRAYATEAGSSVYEGVIDGLTSTLRKEGIRGLFRGAGARVAFHTPSTAITMALFETCRQFFAAHLSK